jgi:signal transduction histidine kinase
MPNPAAGTAPRERAASDVIRAEAALLAAVPLLKKILDSLPVMAAVLNVQRQVVLANERLVQFAGARSADELEGLRPGELLDCVHARETEYGCGTSESCSVCGALRAILLAQLRRGDTELCRMRRHAGAGEEPLELEVWATPLDLLDGHFTLLALADASAAVERDWLTDELLPRALELSVEVEALASALAGDSGVPRERTIALLHATARRLTAVLREHADLPAAEGGVLVAVPERVRPRDLLVAVAADFEAGRGGRAIEIDPVADDLVLMTDPGLLGRVLAKLVANALEATPPGGAVHIGCRRDGDHAEFFVHNPGQIPRAAQLRIFQRGFSTKGPGRGYGMYLARLIAERYLAGAVSLQTEAGTVFSVRLPLTSGEEAGQ